jgi:hypothetical protein
MKMFQYADAPEIGKIYTTFEGIALTVEDIKPNGYWLCRFISHPNEDRGGHRQWVPWWSKGFFTEIAIPPKPSKACFCDGCKTQNIAVVMPLGASTG